MSRKPLSFLNDTDLVLEDFGALMPDEKDEFACDDQNRYEGNTWSERIKIAQSWKSIAQFDSGPYKGHPAALKYSASQRPRFVHLSTCPPSDFDFYSWLLNHLQVCPNAIGAEDVQIYPCGDKLLAAINFGYKDRSITAFAAASQIIASMDSNLSFKWSNRNLIAADDDTAEVTMPARSLSLVALRS